MKADYKRRDIEVNGTVVPPVNNVSVEKKPEPIKKLTKNLFNTVKPKQEKQSEMKMEKTSPVLPKPSENEKKVAPERKSPRKNQSNTKPNQVKSIANFFGSKPTSSITIADKKSSEKSVAEAKIENETVKTEDEPKTNDKSSKNHHKRNLSNGSGKSLTKKPNHKTQK